MAASTPHSHKAPIYQTSEWTFTSDNDHNDPFTQIDVDVLFQQDGKEWKVPAFWAGEHEWRVRFSAPAPGDYRFTTICSDPTDNGLHGREGTLEASPADGDNHLLQHGPIRPSRNARFLQHADGTPFFWLGDTWWMGLCHRLHWPDEFTTLTADRVKKGFSVIQIVMGLYPDMPPFDPRGANEAGFPWEAEYTRIRPEYFDLADRRIRHLVASGLTPCIVGAWGYFMPWLGVDKLKAHWRYLIARYGSMPVTWCIAGEANLPWYLADGFPYDDREQVRGWTEVASYVKETDPYGRLLSIHPTGLGKLTARGTIDDESLLDLDMQQTGHGDIDTLPPTVRTIRESYAAAPVMPVLNSEVNYEGIMGRNKDDIQRLMFWSCVLSGACGHTYGANGLWQLNRTGQPHGNSPHGGNYGEVPWDEAMNLPGSGQLGVAKALLEQYRWWDFTPHQEWVTSEDTTTGPYAAGIPGEVRLIYARQGNVRPGITVRELEPGSEYTAVFVDPSTGERHGLGRAQPGDDLTWTSPAPPDDADWILILET